MTTRIIINPPPANERIIVKPAPTADRIVINTGRQGSPGEAGVAGYTAGAILGGHRCVSLHDDGNVYYTTPTTLHLFAGITEHAANTGADVRVRMSGKITDPSFAFTPDMPVFCGTDGILTQEDPVSGDLLLVGWAVSATVMMVNV
jgi:hypothetical protein